MTNKIIFLLSIFLSSCISKPVTFHKEGDFDAYVLLLREGGGTKENPHRAVLFYDRDSVTDWFILNEVNTHYQLMVLSKDGKKLSETSFTPKEVKRVVISPDSVRKE